MADKPLKFHTPPNCNNWAEFATWDLEQAVALSLGLDPSIVSLATTQSNDFPPELKSRYQHRYAVCDNHAKTGRFLLPVDPRIFLAWAKSNGIRYPAELEEAVQAKGEVIADWRHQNAQLGHELEKARATISDLERHRERLIAQVDDLKLESETRRKAKERPLLPKEQMSLLKLVLGLVVTYCDYVLGGENRHVTTKIVGDLELAGIPIDPGSVQKWIGIAAEQVDLKSADI